MHHGAELRSAVVLCVALAAGALFRSLGERLRVPYTVGTWLAGGLAGLGFGALPHEAGLLASLRDGSAIWPHLLLTHPPSSSSAREPAGPRAEEPA